ncbi:hypothetical protein KVA01_16780 [Kocuria varians]|uniref:Energy-coupling factor transporter transmembrane protein BioN n=1 Tax=Kocuria varians TaxID=1272 RepID=A0A4Y4D7E2_KOCVA|nr:energy-coupling factor transporter transmembrane protein EcfT [Kocuria varians]GEC99523.1 hypothetical protein KVA01_16780 [Kocuria varians]
MTGGAAASSPGSTLEPGAARAPGRRRGGGRSRGDDLLGTYVPGTSPLHRSPLWLKAALVLGACLGVMIARDWRVSLATLALTFVLSAACGLGVRRWARSLRPLALLVAILAVYHVVANGPARAADVVLSLLAVVTLTRLLLTTTPLPQLVDGLVRLCSPLRLIGVDPERIGLAVSLMIRSVPWLFGVLSSLRDAATARTVRTDPVRLVTPAVIATVDYAHRTGEALAARGLE